MRAVQKIPTRRPLFWRIAESKRVGMVAYIASVVTVIVFFAEKLA